MALLKQERTKKVFMPYQGPFVDGGLFEEDDTGSLAINVINGTDNVVSGSNNVVL